MKLNVNMCMKLERHKYSMFFWKDMKIPKNIETNKEICFSFNILGSIRTFKNITTCKMFIFKNSNLELTSNKFVVCLFVQAMTIVHLT
jgi:hypothetical protein